MSRPIITVGAATSHGGVVVTGSPASVINGIPIARVGDSVICPRKGHTGVTIATGDPTFIVDGKPVARHGDKTTCGATLIATQQLCVIEEGGAPIQSSPAVPLLDLSEPPVDFDEPDKEHNLRFHLVDDDGNPYTETEYFAFNQDTQDFFEGITDSNGYTQTIYTEKKENIVLHLIIDNAARD